jgi:hypothetical protein
MARRKSERHRVAPYIDASGERAVTAMTTEITIVVGKRRITIDSSQAWFWTREWQDGEREATNDVGTGRTERYDSDHAFLKSLEQSCSP